MLTLPRNATVSGARYSSSNSATVAGTPPSGTDVSDTTDSTNAAEWNTAPVTETGAAPRRIAFLGAMDVTDPGVTPVTFWVTLNGGHRFALPQPTSDQDQWEVPGADGIRLHFRRLLIDKFGDVHGIFTLDLPSAVAPAGAPVTVRVQGESVGRRSWFILYTVSLRPTVSVHPEQLLTRDGQQTIRLDAWQPFDTAAVTYQRGVDQLHRCSGAIPPRDTEQPSLGFGHIHPGTSGTPVSQACPQRSMK